MWPRRQTKTTAKQDERSRVESSKRATQSVTAQSGWLTWGHSVRKQMEQVKVSGGRWTNIFACLHRKPSSASVTTVGWFLRHELWRCVEEMSRRRTGWLAGRKARNVKAEWERLRAKNRTGQLITLKSSLSRDNSRYLQPQTNYIIMTATRPKVSQTEFFISRWWWGEILRLRESNEHPH